VVLLISLSRLCVARLPISGKNVIFILFWPHHDPGSGAIVALMSHQQTRSHRHASWLHASQSTGGWRWESSSAGRFLSASQRLGGRGAHRRVRADSDLWHVAAALGQARFGGGRSLSTALNVWNEFILAHWFFRPRINASSAGVVTFWGG